MLHRLALVFPLAASAFAQDRVTDVAAQPLAAQARRVLEALELAGEPLEAGPRALLDAALAQADDAALVGGVQDALDAACLARVHVNPESRVEVAPGAAPAELVEQGWRVFLVKVHNEAGVTSELRVSSPQAALPYVRSTNAAEPAPGPGAAEVRERWLELDARPRRPLQERLSGLALEYRLVALYARDRGRREARLVFDVGQGSQDLGFRSELDVLFECRPAVPVTLRVRDTDDTPTTACFEVRDAQGRVYPARTRRIAPDFFFQDQVYRADGETLLLPAGTYDVRWSRGPEYHVGARRIEVPDAGEHEEAFALERWVHPAQRGWFSGDHHVHAAGCAHYEAPSQGVDPAAMMRHIVGENLDVGCVLTWGPCWYFQKGFFEGKPHALSTRRTLLRYDVEVSGFPSSHCGHLCLLRLSEDDYPGAERIEQWPSWNLPVLQWAKRQGAVVGFSHSGWGLEVDCESLPCWEVPRFDGIGANEYVVDWVHGACDFISAVDTPAIWELSIWYHTLNCGSTTRISGETDFPCIYGERVGLGRSYVRQPAEGPLDFDAWTAGLSAGASYVGDGRSHLLDFEVGGLAVGAQGADGRASVLAARAGAPLAVRVNVAALLGERPSGERERDLASRPYWHVERARVGATRQVAVELVVDGEARERKLVEADGREVALEFEYTPEHSSWVALRIFPSSHTNPVFVEVDGKPVRASKRSAEWCSAAVEACWKSKEPGIRASEKAAARAAYDVAAAYYERAAAEATGE
jgi:hypothetical protein